MSAEKNENIIVVGASAGGISAVSKLMAGFNTSFNVAIFIVIHIPRESISTIILREIQRQTDLHCVIPNDGETIKMGTVYLAQTNHHIMIEKNKVRILKGPYENHWRPSIDVLFRTAAAAYSGCVTGIILTGLLDDGTSGMLAIKKTGGRLMVQDLQEAEFKDMPQSVIQNMEVDYQAPIHEMPIILKDLYAREDCKRFPIPKQIELEAAITLRMSSDIEDLEQLGERSDFSCPDCGGLLFKIDEEVPRFRCYTGHTFTEKILESEQLKGIEESIWIAIRMMEERKNLLKTIENYNNPSKIERASQLEMHIERLKAMLLEISSD